MKLTDVPLGPIETHNDGVFVVREDLVRIGGANGTKAVSMSVMAKDSKGIATSGGRESTQALMASLIAKHFNIGYEFHCPTGPETEIQKAIKDLQFPTISHKTGYRTVINARARTSAAAQSGWVHIPGGCECTMMVDVIVDRCETMMDWPGSRLVVPVGSGMTLISLLEAIKKWGRPWPGGVLGVYVANNPIKRIQKWHPNRLPCEVKLVQAITSFKTKVEMQYDGAQVDPVYSGKCIPFLQKDDLLWNSGARQHSLASISTLAKI